MKHWKYGKSIYASLELCADAVLANSTNWLEGVHSHNNNCGAGLGYFFYSETEKTCRCCNAADAGVNL